MQIVCTTGFYTEFMGSGIPFYWRARATDGFLPSTWTQYGQGGDIHNSHDAILAAARYLVRNGAPYNMRNAIFQYNHDFDYVDSVESFARAYRADPGWLDRMYYWNTFG